MNIDTVHFGNLQAEDDFKKRHAKLIDPGIENINALQQAAVGNAKQSALIDRVLYVQIHLIVEDFNEIIFLCAHGLSNGALKILRGMFERTVTLSFLQKHPSEAKRFMDFYWVSH